jgi:hypothetical protein
LKRKDHIDSIIKHSTRFVCEIENYNKLGKYDINLHAEHFLVPVLNLVFDLKLENLNSTKKNNFPAVDLADFENRVAFQITSTSSTQKIKETLEKVEKYDLHDHFDIIYFYILSQKQEKYPNHKIQEVTPKSLTFDPNEHIIDNSSLLRKIDGLSLSKLSLLSKIYQHEFSDVQIDNREKKFSKGYLSHSGEKLFLNVIKINIPEKIYIADLRLKEDVIFSRINDWRLVKGYKQLKRPKNKESLLIDELRHRNMMCFDWLLREGRILTFKNLNDDNEFFSQLVDKGTITEIDCLDYYDDSQDNLRIFKNLLRNTLRQDVYHRGLEWVGKKGLLRFKMDNRAKPDIKKIQWKAKNIAVKTVISEVINKKEGHVVCYKHLAFIPSFEIINNNWYLTLNSTWSFTNPGGYKTSRFEKDYLSGIKRLENNKTIYYFYKFWSYYLMYKDLFSKDNRVLSFAPLDSLFIKTRIDDSKWVPMKESETQLEREGAILEADNELTLNLFQ